MKWGNVEKTLKRFLKRKMSYSLSLTSDFYDYWSSIVFDIGCNFRKFKN